MAQSIKVYSHAVATRKQSFSQFSWWVGFCRMSKKRELAVSLVTPVVGTLWTAIVFASPRVLWFPVHVTNIRSGSCFTVRMGFEGVFDFSVYYRAAQKRDCEPLTPPVLSFPRGKVGPNTTSWKSKSDHFHCHRHQYSVLMTFFV